MSKAAEEGKAPTMPPAGPDDADGPVLVEDFREDSAFQRFSRSEIIKSLVDTEQTGKLLMMLSQLSDERQSLQNICFSIFESIERIRTSIVQLSQWDGRSGSRRAGSVEKAAASLMHG